MWSLRSALLVVLAFLATAQALVLQAAGQLGIRSAAASASPMQFAERCPCPECACRTNLKKEKRARNRVNAFRFKKGGFTRTRRFNGPDYAAEQKKADEDNKFFSLIFTYSAEEAAAAQAGEGKAPEAAASK